MNTVAFESIHYMSKLSSLLQTRSLHFLPFCLAVFGCVSLCISSAYAKVTLVSGGPIYTVSDSEKQARAFAFEGDTIVGVGSAIQLREQFVIDREINLQGASVIPGFIDAHGHLLYLGQSLLQVDLVDTKNKKEIVQRLTDFAKDLPKEQWLLGRGWDQNDWPVQELPSAQDLDAAFPERPVWIDRVDGHAGWSNSAAMKFAAKDLSGKWQVDGGEIVRDSIGQPTGIFIDNAEGLIRQAIPAASEAQLRIALERAMQKTASVGITSIHDAGTSKQVWDILNGLNQQQALKVRVYAMADGNQKMLDQLCEKGPIIDKSAMLTARSVKLYSDGALGSRGAALLTPYSDSPKQMGLLLTEPKTLTKYAKRAADCGLQVNIHAIGDRGNRVTLDALEAASKADNPGRHRVEHSQIIEASDFQRFKDLSLIASVQPTHATSDMYWAEERVGAERIKGAYAWQTFNKLGIPLALGSDFPVERPDPLLGFYAAITRQDAQSWPADGWYPEQILSREHALYGFTKGAAYAAFQEDLLGSLEVGKKADFVILDQDIMSIPKESILNTKIVATYINGKAVYQTD
jgi:predicted amidohydrolase YtcJ